MAEKTKRDELKDVVAALDALADAVLVYLNLKDGPSGSDQQYQAALDNIVAALPADKVPDSLTKEEPV